MTNNLDRRKFIRFLMRNGWEILEATNHNKISFANEIEVNGLIIFKSSKINTNFNCDPIKADLAKQVRNIFSDFIGRKIKDAEFEEAVNKGTKILKIVGDK